MSAGAQLYDSQRSPFTPFETGLADPVKNKAYTDHSRLQRCTLRSKAWITALSGYTSMPSFAGSAGTLPVFWAAFRAEVLIRISVYSLETLLSGGLLIGYPVHLRLVPSCEGMDRRAEDGNFFRLLYFVSFGATGEAARGFLCYLDMSEQAAGIYLLKYIHRHS